MMSKYYCLKLYEEFVQRNDDKMLYLVPRLDHGHCWAYAITSSKGRLQIRVADSADGRDKRHENEIISMQQVISRILLRGFPKVVKNVNKTVIVVNCPLQTDGISCFYHMMSAMITIARHRDAFIITFTTIQYVVLSILII